MISLILIAIAAFFNACMDAFENENFYESIFKGKNPNFWYKRQSWASTPKARGYHVDAWHLSKSAMIVVFCLAIVLYEPFVKPWIDFLIAGVIWNVVFILFYHKIFKIK